MTFFGNQTTKISYFFMEETTFITSQLDPTRLETLQNKVDILKMFLESMCIDKYVIKVGNTNFISQVCQRLFGKPLISRGLFDMPMGTQIHS